MRPTLEQRVVAENDLENSTKGRVIVIQPVGSEEEIAKFIGKTYIYIYTYIHRSC